MGDTDQSHKKLASVFRAWDSDGDGFICKEELHAVFVRLGEEDAVVTALLLLFEEADTNHDGKLDYREFLAWLCCDEAPEKLSRAVEEDWRKLTSGLVDQDGDVGGLVVEGAVAADSDARTDGSAKKATTPRAPLLVDDSSHILVGPGEKDARKFPEWKDDPRYQYQPHTHTLSTSHAKIRKLDKALADKGRRPEPLTRDELLQGIWPPTAAGHKLFLDLFESEAEVWEAVRRFIAVCKRDVGCRECKPYPGPEIAHLIEGYRECNPRDTRKRHAWCGICISAWLFEALGLTGDRSDPASWLAHPFRCFCPGGAGFSRCFAVWNDCNHPPVPESLLPGAIANIGQHDQPKHHSVVIRALGGADFEHVGGNEGKRVQGGRKSLGTCRGEGVVGLVHWWEPAIKHLRNTGRGGGTVPRAIPCLPHRYQSPEVIPIEERVVKEKEKCLCPALTHGKTYSVENCHSGRKIGPNLLALKGKDGYNFKEAGKSGHLKIEECMKTVDFSGGTGCWATMDVQPGVAGKGSFTLRSIGHWRIKQYVAMSRDGRLRAVTDAADPEAQWRFLEL